MIRKTTIWAAKLIISFAILFILYQHIPFSRFSRLLEQASQKHIIAAGLAFLVGQTLLSFRLMVLTNKNSLNLGITELLQVNFTSLFYKLFIPGGTITSIMVRSYKLKQVSKQLDSVVSIILFDRLVSTIGVFIGGFLFWCLHQGFLSQNFRGIFLAILIAMGGLYLCVKMITAIFQFLTQRLPSGIISKKIRDRANAMISFEKLNIHEYTLVFFLTLCNHLMGVLVFIFLAASLNLPLSGICLGWLRAAVIAFTMLPVSFAGLGVRDGAMIYFFSRFDISGHEALAMSFLIFIVTVVLGAIIGGLWELFSLLKKKQPIARSQ